MSTQTAIERKRADLNRLRDTVHSTQKEEKEYPGNPKNEVYADNKGKIVEAEELTPEELKIFIKIQQKIFRGLFSTRLSRDRKAVRKKTACRYQGGQAARGCYGLDLQVPLRIGDPFYDDGFL